MTTSPGWPYAAKAVIQHEWDVDQLNLWLTFSQAMKQTTTPDLGLWIAHVDGTTTPAIAQEWQDAFTLLVILAPVLALPSRVLCGFAGPSHGLIATTGKQWEPFGPILSQPLTG